MSESSLSNAETQELIDGLLDRNDPERNVQALGRIGVSREMLDDIIGSSEPLDDFIEVQDNRNRPLATDAEIFLQDIRTFIGLLVEQGEMRPEDVGEVLTSEFPSELPWGVPEQLPEEGTRPIDTLYLRPTSTMAYGIALVEEHRSS